MEAPAIHCDLCGCETAVWARARILGKYDIVYRRCPSCGFVRTETPYWLEEAYSEAISRSDLGLVWRNLYYAKRTKYILSLFFRDPLGKYVDYGGGYGLFTRLMRDSGFDYYHYDKFCRNLFAEKFEAVPGRRKFSLLTAFEVFEHMSNPLEEIDRMFSWSDHILFSTELIGMDPPQPSDWWYFCLETGQHVSFYTRRSLGVIADRFGKHLYTNGRNLHLMTAKKIRWPQFLIFPKDKWVERYCFLAKSSPLFARDYETVTGKGMSQGIG